MRRVGAIVGTTMLLACAGAQAAPVFRCTESGGAVTYQELPCAGPTGRAVDIPSSFPPVNSTERDRLLQREAALDARLLKRAEIESAERIARDERSAREAVLLAEQSREAQASYAVPWGYGFYRPALHRPPPYRPAAPRPWYAR